MEKSQSNKSCSGPCLTHCYTHYKFSYIMFGIFIGLVVGSLLLKPSNSIANLSNLA